MKLNFDKKMYEAKWYDFGDCKLKIRPYTIGQGDIIFRKGDVVQSGNTRWEMFDYSLVDWEGIADLNGKLVPCNEETKRLVFDYALGGIATFVITKNSELVAERQEEEKN